MLISVGKKTVTDKKVKKKNKKKTIAVTYL